jgi:hypothetical protein
MTFLFYSGIPVHTLTRKSMSQMERHFKMLEKLGFSSTLFWVNTNTQMMFPVIGRLSEQFNQ